ncbi:hypothetical protein [Vibrio pelagius]
MKQVWIWLRRHYLANQSSTDD